MTAFQRAVEAALEHLVELPTQRVANTSDFDRLEAPFGGPLPESSTDPVEVVDELVRAATAGLVASPGPRYFGFVTGGAVPAALAADILTSAWDQNSAFAVMSPAAAVAEEVALGWVQELLGLESCSGALVTGAQMANVTCLLAARHHVLAGAGWDDLVEGLSGAPPVRVVVGEEAHATLLVALRYIGLSTPTEVIAVDDQGRMDPTALRAASATWSGPTIVCSQAGNVNTGAIDPLADIASVCQGLGAWHHVDGAFGLWAAASPSLRSLVAGHASADSWATDAHKWLNVPYDCGIALTRHPESHRSALRLSAPYLATGGQLRDGADWAPEASRRARGFVVWAAIKSLGRDGVAELVDRNCALARLIAKGLDEHPAVQILNDVVLNQVLVRFSPEGDGDPDALTVAVIAAVQADGRIWAGGTVWRGMHAMRISVSNWSTTEADAQIAVQAILEVLDRTTDRGAG